MRFGVLACDTLAAPPLFVPFWKICRVGRNGFLFHFDKDCFYMNVCSGAGMFIKNFQQFKSGANMGSSGIDYSSFGPKL